MLGCELCCELSLLATVLYTEVCGVSSAIHTQDYTLHSLLRARQCPVHSSNIFQLDNDITYLINTSRPFPSSFLTVSNQKMDGGKA